MTDGPVLPGLDETNDQPPGIGDNNPPGPIAYDEAEHARLADITQNFIVASDQWLNVDLTDALAKQLADQLTGLRKLRANVEGQRVKEKKPHDELADAVQAAYKPLVNKIDTALKRLKSHLGSYIAKKEQEVAAEKERKAAAARAAEDEARLAAMQAEDSIDAAAEAEAAEKRAKAAAAEAARAAKKTVKVQSASGAGRTVSTRSRRVVKIANARHLFLYYQDRQEVLEVLERLANAEVNSKGFPKDGSIPGALIYTTTQTA